MRLSMKEMRKKYLNRELFVLSLLSFGISVLVYFVLSSSSSYLLAKYYNTEEHIEKLEKKYAEDLQSYIEKEKITVQNIGKIDEWVFDREDVFPKVFVNGNIIYDAMYGATDKGGERRKFWKDKSYELKLGSDEARRSLL